MYARIAHKLPRETFEATPRCEGPESDTPIRHRASRSETIAGRSVPG
jgi:hypothetical protein